MIGVTTEGGTLRIAAEIPIPNGQSWTATRVTQLIAHIERFVFAAELADAVPRKPNFKSGLVVIPEDESHAK